MMRRLIAILFVVLAGLLSVTPAAAGKYDGGTPGPKPCICLPSPVAS